MANATELGVDSVVDVLVTVFGLDGDVVGDEFKLLCINPSHDDRDPSMAVNTTTGYWNCFACGIGGDLLDLGKRALDIPQREVRQRLKPSTPEAVLAAVQRKIAAIHVPGRERKARTITLPGPYEDGPLDELYERGFHDDTLRRWGIRFCDEETLTKTDGESFTITNSIAIPIRDRNGHLLAWCYRATKGSARWQQENARYLYTPGFPISEVWYGLEHHDDADEIAVVEGALDTAWLDQCGFPAKGMLGSKMGDRKIMQLQKHRTVTLFADRDSAGAQWVQRVGNMISNRTALYVVVYDKRITRTYVDPGETDKKKRKIDPQMLLPVDVELLMAKRIPWMKFARRLAAT